MPKFPCKICSKRMAKNNKAICFDLCDICIHTKCNKINAATCKVLQNEEIK